MKLRLKKFVFVGLVCSFMLWMRPAESLSSVSVILTNPSVGAGTSVTVSFKVDGGIQWVSGGSIRVTFPGTFNLTNVTAADTINVLGVDGGFSNTVVAGAVVTATRSGTGPNITDTDCKIQIDNIVNPAATGVTGTFTVAILDGATVLDTSTAPGVVISEPLELGGSSNHSKFCLVEAIKENPLLPVLTFLFLVSALGTGLKNKKVSVE